MTIDWANFTPWTSLAGGITIGIAAALLILFIGRVAGISGVLGEMLRPNATDKGWRIAFIAGLIVAPLAYQLVHELPFVTINAKWPLLIAAGLLVGIGTRYGAGCTSGHGVCGLSRFSKRSLVATIAFMAAGFITVFVLRHLLPT
jgi:uncharacterized membrane protein YedE/YeeE